MDRLNEDKSASVFKGTKQAEDTYGPRWKWVERSVWTKPMLAALERGVKGGKWFSLIDKVHKPENLNAAFDACWKNRGSAGIDRQTVQQFKERQKELICKLSKELEEGSYRPLPVLRTWIDKPGSNEKRPLGIPAVTDRVVQGGTRNVLEPIFEKAFAEHSYGFRPGRGCKQALKRVDELLAKGNVYVVDVDFKSYFDTIPHEKLMDRVKEHISDGRVLALLEQFLKAGVMEELKEWQPTEEGTPQGAVISPLLANLYLNDLDHLIAGSGQEMTRYADDFVVQCQTREEAEKAMEKIRTWSEANGLILHPTKTRIVNAAEPGGFDFLGYHFERGMKWPRKKSLDKIKDTIREMTPRKSGQSLGMIVYKLNKRLRGWHQYFKHSIPNVMDGLDGMIRRRLRRMMIKREGKAGTGKGRAQNRWPNAYFEGIGLFRLGSRTLLKSQFE